MKIEIYASGYCHDNGKNTQRSGASIILRSDDGLNKSRRVISHPTGAGTQSFAEISAARLALASVKRKYRKEAEVKVYLPAQAVGFLQKKGDKYKKNSKKYENEVEELRRWADYYSDLTVDKLGKGDDADHATEEAKECADTQKPKDTRTQLVDG